MMDIMSDKPEPLDKVAVVNTWLIKGIEDFYFGFYLQKISYGQNIFYCHQGLEKLCKAYLLGKEAARYEDLPFYDGKKVVDDIAKKNGHSLKTMFQRLIDENILKKEFLTKEYDGYLVKGKWKSISGKECLRDLDKAYIECRYPVPQGVHESYPIIKDKGWFSPLDSSGIKDFAYEAGLRIYDKIKEEYNLSSCDNSFATRENEEGWKRFHRIFFKHS